MNLFECDVVIVGGGPAGLWLACELRLAGAEVCVLERRRERVGQSRALTIHGRTLEVFALRGLAGRFLARGTPLPTGHFAVLDTRLDFSGFDTAHPYTLFIPQERTEALIEERAQELGVRLLRGHMVHATGQGAAEVFAQGEGPRGPFRADGRFLVGADGARSGVRRHLGIGFPGVEPARVYAMGDVRVDMPAGRPVLSVVNAAGTLMVAPLGDGRHHRIVLLDAVDHGLDLLDRPLTLEELARSTSRILGSDLGARDPIWLSRFSDETRLAARYRDGRSFLVGDAAHIHLPAGGQGMNVGIQDAHNLGWKLGAFLKGHAPEAILDSFEAERRPVGLALYENTLAQGALMSAVDPQGQALRAMMNRLLRDASLNRRLAGELSGFALAYPDPLPLGIAAEFAPPGGIGERIGDQALELADGRATTLYDLLSDGSWVGLTLDDGPDLPLPTDLRPEAVRQVRARRRGTGGALDAKGAVLVRPDGYSAAVRGGCGGMAPSLTGAARRP